MQYFCKGDKYIHDKCYPVIELYREGKSSEDIREILNIPVSVRSIQRMLKAKGEIRPFREALKLSKDKHDTAIRKYWKEYQLPHKKGKTKTTPGVRYKVLRRDNFKCVLCGNDGKQSPLQVDHIVPEIHGGGHTEDNLRTLCFECNIGRNNVDVVYRK